MWGDRMNTNQEWKCCCDFFLPKSSTNKTCGFTRLMHGIQRPNHFIHLNEPLPLLKVKRLWLPGSWVNQDEMANLMCREGLKIGWLAANESLDHPQDRKSKFD